MDDKQTNQLGLGEKVATFLTSHAADLTATPEISTTLLPLLQSQVQTTLNNDTIATQDNTGHTEDKSDDRINLEDSVYHVSTGLVSYADDTDDFVLQNMIEFPISTIQGFRDMRLAQYAETVLEKVALPAVAAALAAKHNVSAADITELQTLTTSFKAKIATPLEKRAAAAYGKLVDRNIAAVKQTTLPTAKAQPKHCHLASPRHTLAIQFYRCLSYPFARKHSYHKRRKSLATTNS